MEFGLFMPTHGAFASKENISFMAKGAEEAGFESIWVADHIVIPWSVQERFGSNFYEAFSTLGYLAAITERVKLGTSVVVLPYRHPVMLAKQIATIDQLSNGRFILGAAFGWTREEYDILGVPFARRGKRSDEMLEVMNRLWQEGDNGFEGEFYKFDDFAFEPKPVQQPRPPIWIGGNNERAIQRVVKYGDGWHPVSSAKRPGSVQWNLADLRRRLAYLDELASEAGRDPSKIIRSLVGPLVFDMDPTAYLGDAFSFVGSADEIRRNLDTAREIGLDQITLNFWYTVPGLIHEPSLDNVKRTFDRFVKEILPHYVD